MIHFVRTAAIAPGKMREAIAFAHTVSAHLQKTLGLSVTVMMPIGGNPNRIGWTAQYASLAALEQSVAKMMADQTYLEMVAASAASFLAGSVHDEIWQSM